VKQAHWRTGSLSEFIENAGPSAIACRPSITPGHSDVRSGIFYAHRSREKLNRSIGEKCFRTPIKLSVKTITYGFLDTRFRSDSPGASPERLKMNARFAVPMTGKRK
jgi:hypothetical protein